MQFNNTTKPIISFMPQNPRRPALSFSGQNRLFKGHPKSWFSPRTTTATPKRSMLSQMEVCLQPVSLQIHRPFAMPTNQTKPTNRQTKLTN
jgi:hypothetical protein